ncbi:MAG TPA: formate--tetrahydrofolate ligase, partial [Spirochaetales bacterium]|nr:formate--tetrahydrofolate ligase [Spirochaetales bacterium]
MKLDPTKLKDWQIAEAAEKHMKTVYQLAEELNLDKMELLPYGHYIGKLDYLTILERFKDKPDGKYIEVTAITPTPLGEGKTTTAMGLVEGLGAMGKRVIGAIRQPSGGPTFNIKGSAAGGGLAQCIPLTDFSLGLTGDIDAITNAHNLAMVAVTSRLQHEFNYSDAVLARKNLKRLNIDPRNPAMGWAIDFSAQALREILIGIGGKMDGFLMKSGFQITVSSEIMAILAVASDLRDMRRRISRIVVAYDKSGNPITAEDLEVAGAMTAIMCKAINPNLMQTLEGQPVLVHAGPFANIAIGQSSIIADRLALKLADYHVTESGFGADIGFEKFWNLKCRFSGLKPNCSVIVCTIRALKMHGGGPRVAPGKPLDKAYTEQNTQLVEKGMENLLAHIETVKKSGLPPVVCINHFYTDTEEEIRLIR